MGFWAGLKGAVSSGASWLGNAGSSALSSGALSIPDFFGMNYVLNRHSAKEAYRRQKYMYLLDRDYQAWYNSPVHQMDLLKQAKLNPNLIYEGGSSGLTVGSTKVPSVQAYDVPSGGGANFMRNYLESKLLNEQIKNTQQQNKESKSRADLNVARTEKQDLETRILRTTGLPPGASATRSFYEDVKGTLIRAKNKWDELRDTVRTLSKDSDRPSEKKFDLPKRKSYLPSASDRSLFDYLYDNERSTGRRHSDLNRYFPEPYMW